MDAMTEQRTLEKFEKKNERLVRDFGYGATAGGLGLTQRCLKPLTDYIAAQFDAVASMDEKDATKHFIRLVRNLSPEAVALCTLQNLIHAIAIDRGLRDCALILGRAIQSECFGEGLLRHDAKLAGKIVRAVKRRHGNHKYRTQAARSIAKRAGFMVTDWGVEQRVRAGLTLIEWAQAACSWAFVSCEHGHPTLTKEALEVVENAVEHELLRTTVALPLTEPPLPWTGYACGGYADAKVAFSRPLVRTFRRETIAAVKAAIKDGTMQPTLDALNSIQNVAWRINERVLDVMKWCYENGVTDDVGLPRKDDLPLLARPERWDELDADRQRAWKIRAAQVHTRNRGLVSDRVLFAEDLRTAGMLAGAPFWTPCNLDWRGRVYPLPHFNFQRDDRVRALFLFSRGQSIGEDGLSWLKVHAANCGDFDKISKRPIEERIRWVDQNSDMIRDVARAPLSEGADWMTADKPFMFLAACFELTAALEEGPSFVTHLPVSFDGSCSGLQHLCAMTRAPEGAYVNLTPSDAPQDVYELVAERVRKRIAEDTDARAALWRDFGIDRKLVKRNVMTYSYSSKTFGMSEQHMEDLMRPLGLKVLEGNYLDHPFGEDEGRSAAKYLARHVYTAIEEIVTKPAEAMGFLQKCARTLAHEGKPLNWTTPTGLPWSNRYHLPVVKTVELWLHDVRVCMNLTVGDQKQIDKDKAANGVAPNFVHACDAAHLMLTVNAAVDEGITDLALVHDSFGCLAPVAGRYNEIIREQFVQMYEQHDVLAEVLERAKCDLTVHNTQRLPDMVVPGDLNLKGVLDARYAFA